MLFLFLYQKLQKKKKTEKFLIIYFWNEIKWIVCFKSDFVKPIPLLLMNIYDSEIRRNTYNHIYIFNNCDRFFSDYYFKKVVFFFQLQFYFNFFIHISWKECIKTLLQLIFLFSEFIIIFLFFVFLQRKAI